MADCYGRASIAELERLVLGAMPGWRFVTSPVPFTRNPDRYLRAQLACGDTVRDVILRKSWRDEGFTTEQFLYSCILPKVGLRVPRLWAVIEQTPDASKWLVLEDLGRTTGCSGCLEHRLALLHALGRFHAEGMELVNNRVLDGSPIPRFDGKSILFGASYVPFQYWQDLLRRALEFSEFRLSQWALSFADTLWQELVRQPPTLLHGDVAFDNCIVSDRGPIGLIDFERALVGPPSIDIGRIMEFIKSAEEIEAYRKGFEKYSRTGIAGENVIRWAWAGDGYNCIRWMCYYIEQREQGRLAGEEWSQALYWHLHRRLCHLFDHREELVPVNG